MATNTYVSIIAVNVNELNAPIKRQSGRLEKEQEPTICCLQQMYLTAKDTHRLKMRSWKKRCYIQIEISGSCDTPIRQNRL